MSELVDPCGFSLVSDILKLQTWDDNPNIRSSWTSRDASSAGPLCCGPLQRTPLGLAHLWWVGSEDVPGRDGLEVVRRGFWPLGKQPIDVGQMALKMDELAWTNHFPMVILHIELLVCSWGTCCCHCMMAILYRRTMQLMVQLMESIFLKKVCPKIRWFISLTMLIRMFPIKTL